jgi:hypothetical protein
MKKIIVLLSAAFIATPALAEGVTLKEKAACTPDAFKFCHHLKVNKDAPDIATQLISCLQQNRSALRPACAAVFTKRGM